VSVRPLGILTLTHSSRATEPDRCSVQFLTRRFGRKDRLADPPPFERLPPAPTLYSGALSFYLVAEEDDGRVHFRRLGRVRSRDRIQHATFLPGGDLLVGYEHRVVRWRPRAPLHELEKVDATDFQVAARCDHPHLAGLHTIAPLGETGDLAALSSAAADAVLLLDTAEMRIERTLRLPRDLYGRNYDLAPGMDLRRHYIHDELQTTHVNAAHGDAAGRWIAVSTFIQGAIGVFDLDTGRYEEVTRGFVGCHGARFDERGNLYFADSTAGHLAILTDDGKIARRFAVPSRWLHDVQQLRGPVHAFALADANELQVWDVDRDELLFRDVFPLWIEDDPGAGDPHPAWVGNSVQALGWRALTP
jgi:hypothetical protein